MKAALRAGIALLAFGSPAVAATKPMAAGAHWTFENARPTLESADGRFSLAIRGRLQWDSGLFADEGASAVSRPASGAIVRRAYLGVEGRALRNFWYEYRMDFGVNAASSESIINVARIAYNFGNTDDLSQTHVRVNAGLIQPLLTHEDGVSSASLTFLERAGVVNVATTAFGGTRPKRGVELIYQHSDALRTGDNLIVSGAITGWQPDNGPSVTKQPAQVLGRTAYRLWSDGVSNVQIGGSMAWLLNGSAQGAARTVTLQDRPEIRVDGKMLASGGSIPVRGGSLWGMDAEMNLRNVFLEGEYYRFGLDRDTTCVSGGTGPGGACLGGGDPDFSGWYVTASWILTGETKTYVPLAMNKQTGTFNNPVVSSPFEPGKGWGAVEVAARYSQLDLNWNAGTAGTPCTGALTGCIRGGEQRIWTFGVNWYLNNNVRMLADYMLIDVDRLDAAGQEIGQRLHVVGLRLQLAN